MTTTIRTLSLLITGLVSSSLVGCSAGAATTDESISDTRWQFGGRPKIRRRRRRSERSALAAAQWHLA